MTPRIVDFLLLACLSAQAPAATHGHGHVRLSGTILDTACAIAAGDTDQSIEIGTLPVSDVLKNGRGREVPFTVRLVNCVLSGGDHWKDVRITFNGEPDGAHRFALQGRGKGEALVIADARGAEATPGEAMPAATLEPGSMALRYRMWLTADSRALQPGDFHTTVRYFMEYD